MLATERIEMTLHERPVANGTPPSRRFGLLSGVFACLKAAPLGVFAILVYAALNSTTIRGANPLPDVDYYQPEINIGDGLLGVGVIALLVTRRVRLSRGILLWLVLSATMVLVSFASSESPSASAVIAAMAYWLRFSGVFSLMVFLSSNLDEDAVEGLLYATFAILAVSSLAVAATLGFQEARLYASGMYISSFSQAAAAVSLVALSRRRYRFLAFSVSFLVLTFSVTAITIFGVLALGLMAFAGGSSFRRKLYITAFTCLVVSCVFFAASSSDAFSTVIALHLDPSTFHNLHGRTEIWRQAWLRVVGDFAFLGHGYNTSPLALRPMYLLEASGWSHISNFHSIVFELLWGLGVGGAVVYLLVGYRALAAL